MSGQDTRGKRGQVHTALDLDARGLELVTLEQSRDIASCKFRLGLLLLLQSLQALHSQPDERRSGKDVSTTARRADVPELHLPLAS
jgi:hypothetical protein